LKLGLNYAVSGESAMRVPSLTPLILGAVMLTAATSAHADEETTVEAKEFIATFVEKFRPLDVAGARAWWDANITGKDEDFKRKEEAQNAIDAMLSDKETFAKAKKLKDSGKIDDPTTQRAIQVIYLMHIEKQVDEDLLKQLTSLGNKLEKTFANFRAKVDGKEMTDAQVREILKTSKLTERRKAVYEASKEIGKLVEKDLAELVRLRNQVAKKLGFANYHALQLFVNEQNGGDLIKLFDELDDLTREPFAMAKAAIDIELAKNCGVKAADLMPWHYHDPFFQEAPAVFKTDFDKIYQSQDHVALCRDFYRGIGLPIDLVIERSGDFKPAKGKNPHAFCIDITRDGTDVRVLANVVPNEYWMSTMLHEMGHAVYSSINIPETLPYVLRTEAHILTTEGIAMMFEKMSKRRGWLEKMGVKVDDPDSFDEAARRSMSHRLLIFSRWCQVMLRFEKGMYENPDQDLNKLWWDMVEKYQMLKRPEGRSAPDYGSKFHIIGAPVYYHNYMMGELFASQLHHAITRDLYKGSHPDTVVYVGNKDVGEYLRRHVFQPGRTLSWNELTRHATGAGLNAKAFAQDFGGK